MEDDREIASWYRHILVSRGHTVTITRLGEECLQTYTDRLQESFAIKTRNSNIQLFDVVILDFKMPDRNGLEVAKEILTINPHQRIIIASAYLVKTLIDGIRQLSVPIEILEKPISNKMLIDTIEDTAIYEELRKLKIDIEPFKLSHELLKKILDILKKRNVSK
jgi:two-component system cell cycle response regulator CpdR